MKSMCPKDPKRLLSSFIVGSLLVMFLCLGVTAAIYSFAFVHKENQRSLISHQQLLQAFATQYGFITEEMWTGNFESISVRVQDIAALVGAKEVELFLTDENGECLLMEKGVQKTTTCTAPHELNELLHAKYTAADFKPTLKFNTAQNRNIYMVPLYIGPILKGYLYASLSDPYEFYKGSTLRMAGQVFLPAILLILLIWSIWLVLSQRILLKPYLSTLLALEKKEILVHFAEQVAHDVKSPLGALLAVTATLKEIPEEKRKLIQAATSRIKDLANNFSLKAISLDKDPRTLSQKSEELSSSEEYSIQLISNLVDSVVSEKRIQTQTRLGLELHVQVCSNSYGMFSKIQPNELRRVLSNLIDNSTESILSKGQIIIKVKSEKGFIHINVEDNGKGIAPEIIPILGTRGATFGKPQGRGLGLYHARETIKRWGGTIEVISTLESGTTVTLKLPEADAPHWLKTKLEISETETVAILDDDPSIHEIWKHRFQLLPEAMSQLVHFKSGEDLLDWIKNKKENTQVTVLCDYELEGQKKNGLQVIKQLDSATHKVVLVTSHFENKNIQNECSELGIGMVPKELAAMVPIERL